MSLWFVIMTLTAVHTTYCHRVTLLPQSDAIATEWQLNCS